LEIIFTIFAIPIWCLWQAGKGLLWLIVNFGHILLIPVAFFLAIGIGTSIFIEPMVEGYEDNIKEEYVHSVTVYWNDDRTVSDTFYVREDLNWTLNKYDIESPSHDYYTSLYYEENCPDMPVLPSNAYQSGGKFLGLFTSPYGVEQYVDSNGYSLKNVKSDIVLYAVFENGN
jgi:hypothetical protein